MIIKGIVEEDFVNYKKPSMVIMFPTCTFKCEKDCGQRVCQNGALANAPDITIENSKVCARYLSNPITRAIVCGGLEPMDSFDELYSFIYTLRYEYRCNDDIVIYSGYTATECEKNGWVQKLSLLGNIVIKFGRFVPNQKPHRDRTLGVNLASDNQYAIKFNPYKIDVMKAQAIE